ncbi:hypothetical protein RR48_11405 [Papilio machaon]|uniref:Uncharacterized protein n=1 Tax=Papilio machaon TaxID=76193 RepID=A0A194QTN5_PAPMA|nr:hypothetical protein RR48_11405 [Papilio machaon]
MKLAIVLFALAVFSKSKGKHLTRCKELVDGTSGNQLRGWDCFDQSDSFQRIDVTDQPSNDDPRDYWDLNINNLYTCTITNADNGQNCNVYYIHVERIDEKRLSKKMIERFVVNELLWCYFSIHNYLPFRLQLIPRKSISNKALTAGHQSVQTIVLTKPNNKTNQIFNMKLAIVLFALAVFSQSKGKHLTRCKQEIVGGLADSCKCIIYFNKGDFMGKGLE